MDLVTFTEEWKDSEPRANPKTREANPKKVVEDEVNAIGGITGFKQKQGQIIAMGSFVPLYL